MPHGIPKEENRATRKCSQEGNDADESHVTRHLKLKPTEKDAVDAETRAISCNTTFLGFQVVLHDILRPPHEFLINRCVVYAKGIESFTSDYVGIQ